MANLRNLAADFVATAPSPATSGTTLSVRTGRGASFPAVPFYATVTPQGQLSTTDNSEIVLVTAVSTDTFTITRAQRGTTAQSIATNWVIANSIYVEDIDYGIFNVKAYGAKGDGSTNDSTAINAAIAAIPSTGGTLFFPPGTYIINAALNIPSYVKVRGSGRRATRLFKSGGTYPIFSVQGTAGGNLEKITFQDFSLEGNAQTGVGWDIDYAQLIYWYDVEANGFNDSVVDAKSMQDSYFQMFSANTNHHATNPVINLYGASGWSTNMVWFNQVRIEDFWSPAISISQGSGYSGNNNGFFFNACKFESTQVGADICTFDTSVQEVHMKMIFLSAGGFKSGYSTPINGINFTGTLNNSFEDVFMNGSSGIVASVIKTLSGSGATVIGNLNCNVTPTVAQLNFNGTQGAKYSIGQISGSTPFIGGTATDNYISTDTTLNGKLSTTSLKIGSTSTVGYVWTATDTAGNGSWQAASGGGGSGTPGGSNTQVQFNNSGAFGGSSLLTWDGSNLQTLNLKAYGANASYLLYNTNDSTTKHGHWKLTYDSNQIGYSATSGDDTSNLLYVGKGFLSNTLIGTAHTNAILKPGDLFNIIDDGAGNMSARGIMGQFLSPPATPTSSTATTGGTVTAGTYYYVVTSIDSVGGESIASPEKSQVVPAGTSTNTVTITWGAVTGATSYRIYRGTVSGAQTIYYTSAVPSYTDTGSSSTAGTPPSLSTAYINKINPSGSSFIRSGVTTLNGIVLLNSSAITMPDFGNMVLGTGGGTQIGTTTGQQLAFHGASPTAQQSATTDLGVVLSTKGLRAAGTAYTITTSGAAILSGSVQLNGNTRFGYAGAALSANTTLVVGTSNNYQMANATTASFTVTLPTTTSSGYMFTIKKIDSSANTVTIKAGAAGTIDATNTYVLSTQYKYVTVISSSTSDGWYIIGNN